MHYRALATDFDETLAHEGRVSGETLASLRTLRTSGRKAILVTGRELPDLLNVFPEVDLFDRVVAENGALLYRPARGEEQPLAAAPPAVFVEQVRRAGVDLRAGRVILSASAVHEPALHRAIRELALPLHTIRNKGSVMVLPEGVDKTSGLRVALAELGLTLDGTVAVGDAENDQGMLAAAACGVAVANALEPLKRAAAWVTRRPRGAGVEQLIERLLADDLRSLVRA